MDWREEYKKKTVSAEVAVKVVKSGDWVFIPIGQSLELLPLALWARKDELKGVKILQGANPPSYPWYQPGYEDNILVIGDQYSGPLFRPLQWDRRGDFCPVGYALTFKGVDESRPGAIEPDVTFVVVSPPNEHGFCSFGDSLFHKKDFVRKAKKVVAEVNSLLIRTYGDNFVHVSEIDCFVEATPYVPSQEELDDIFAQFPPEYRADLEPSLKQMGTPPHVLWKFRAALPFISQYPISYIKGILGMGDIPEYCYPIRDHLRILIKDGDTIQIGTGSTSNPTVRAGLFDGMRDLGLHSEVIPPGVIPLVKEGIFTGKYKTIHPGKVVTPSYWPATSYNRYDAEYINENPLFELYSLSYCNNVRTISAHDNMASIQNALFVDLNGQIGSETRPGFLLENGPGGTLDWVVGALNSKGGRSIFVLPSTAVGGGVSRIVPVIEEEVMVTVPRAYADFIITEYGIASLLGKSQRQRAEELIAIAHPDFRAGLKKEAQRLFGL